MTKIQALTVAFWVVAISFVHTIVFQAQQLIFGPTGSSTFGIESVLNLAVHFIVLAIIYHRSITFEANQLVLGALGFVLIQLPMSVMIIWRWIENIRLTFVIRLENPLNHFLSINHAMPIITLVVLSILVLYALSKRKQLHQEDVAALYNAGLIYGVVFALFFFGMSVIAFSGQALITVDYSLSSILKTLVKLFIQNLFAIVLVPLLGKAFGLKNFKLNLSNFRYLAGYYFLISSSIRLVLEALRLLGQGILFITQNELLENWINFSFLNTLIAVTFLGVGLLLIREPKTMTAEV